MGLFSKKQDNTEDKKKPVKAEVKPAAKTKTDAAKKSEVKIEKAETSMKDLYGEGAGKAVKTTDEKSKKQTRTYGNAHKILVKPLITEKAANLGAENKYVFAVYINANKIEIAKAVEEVYGIKPVSVNIINIQGKTVRYGRKTGRRKDWKKAIVMLPKGKTINIYEGV
jgi:large subunit ribosomal protein L23